MDPAEEITAPPTSSFTLATPASPDPSEQDPDEQSTPVAEQIGQPPTITLHYVCGFDPSGLSAVSSSYDTHEFGQRGLPILVPSNVALGHNVTMFHICPDPSDIDNDIGYRFKNQSAHITIGQFVHGWDLRSTFRATLSRGDLMVPMGVRIFDHHQHALRDYLNIAQTNLHVAVSIERFCKDFLSRVDPNFVTTDEWNVLETLRFQEEMVGHMHEPIPSPYGIYKAFTAKELIEGPRDVYSLDQRFSPIYLHLSSTTALHQPFEHCSTLSRIGVIMPAAAGASSRVCGG